MTDHGHKNSIHPPPPPHPTPRHKQPNFLSTWTDFVPEVTSSFSTDHETLTHLSKFCSNFLIGPVRVGKGDPKPFETAIYFVSSIPNNSLLLVRKCILSEPMEGSTGDTSTRICFLSLSALKRRNVRFLVSTESSILEAFLNKKRVYLGLLLPSKFLRRLFGMCLSSLIKYKNRTNINYFGLRELAWIHLIWAFPQMMCKSLRPATSL